MESQIEVENPDSQIEYMSYQLYNLQLFIQNF